MVLNSTYDVLVLGGGVAGCAAAIALKRIDADLSIVIVESREDVSLNGGRGYQDKRIGETLPPHVVPLFKQLGLWSSFVSEKHLQAAGTEAAWGGEALYENDFMFTRFGQGWHLDRNAFDRWIADEARKLGIVFVIGARLREQGRRGDEWTCRVQLKDGMHELKSNFIIDATGRHAAFARKQHAKRISDDSLVGIYGFFDMQNSEADSTVLIEATEYGWWYASMVPGNQQAVVLMTDADIARQGHFKDFGQWLSLLQKTRYVWSRICRMKSPSNVQSIAAHSQCLSSVHGDGWLAVGDAATAYDPLSSQGLFKAMRTGILASYAIKDFFNLNPTGLKKYQALVEAEYRAYLERKKEFYGQEERWAEAAFWHRRNLNQAYLPQGV